jgi:uncharacterized protein YdhG (YjbR/CyaY superfamily)
MPAMIHYDNVDAYISAQPEDLQLSLQQLRETIKKSAPAAVESISYCMPAYKYLGKPLVYFAAQKKHIGFYALPQAVDIFKNQLAEYETSKGTIRFPLDKPLPLKLIRDIVKMRVAENKVAAERKQTTKKTKPSAAKLKKA